jgi:hypothetical protein
MGVYNFENVWKERWTAEGLSLISTLFSHVCARDSSVHTKGVIRN